MSDWICKSVSLPSELKARTALTHVLNGTRVMEALG
ncbi:hypothetical protein ABIB68_004793 [Bradyrhizobium sp. F1.2.2]